MKSRVKKERVSDEYEDYENYTYQLRKRLQISYWQWNRRSIDWVFHNILIKTQPFNPKINLYLFPYIRNKMSNDINIERLNYYIETLDTEESMESKAIRLKILDHYTQVYKKMSEEQAS